MKVDSFKQLMLGNRKFVRNYYVPAKDAYLTCFMDDDLICMHGYCIAKYSDLRVVICCFLEFKLHGYCLTYKFGNLISLEHYEEGNIIDQPLVLVYRQNFKFDDDVDQNNVKRTCIQFNGSFNIEKRIENTHGFLSYMQNGIKISENGVYNSKLHLSGTG